jgi:hypothetical protein
MNMLDIRPDHADVRLTCCDCGASFLWSVGEQTFYQAKKLSAPKRCKPCRQTKRSRRTGGEDLRLF